MKKIKKYENKKVLVLGLAKSGVCAAKLLHDLGAFVTVNDFQPFEENKDAQTLLELGIRVITGHHPVELLDEDFSLIVKNPGIPYNNPILEKAIEKKLPIITEVELAYEISEAPFIGITGTNGKTTTTTMIGKILNEGREKGRAYLAGNIGIPASGEAQKVMADDILVTELSSFQLLGIESFHPEIAVITNMYETHIDYHGSREAYVKAKWRIQQNMSEKDFLILNYNQVEQKELAQTTKAKVVPFSTKEIIPDGAYEQDGKLYFKGEYIMDSSDLGVVGSHNVENGLAAIAVAKLLKIDNKSIHTVLSEFTGVEHRTEFVTEINGRKFYNDSKATNILATQKALSGFLNEKVILLAGGLDRGNTFEELMSAIHGLKGIVLFGETSSKIKEVAKDSEISLVKEVINMEEAVKLAYEMSDEGDFILLSPACASWDQFPNFEVRGTVFKEAVQQLKR